MAGLAALLILGVTAIVLGLRAAAHEKRERMRAADATSTLRPRSTLSTRDPSAMTGELVRVVTAVLDRTGGVERVRYSDVEKLLVELQRSERPARAVMPVASQAEQKRRVAAELLDELS